MKIKDKIKQWLLKDEVQIFEQTQYELTQTRQELKYLIDLISPISDIGVDVHIRGQYNWAVICIHGKTDFVKFINMERKDVREISSFLRRFEKSNVCVDHPYPDLFRGSIRFKEEN